MRTGTVEVGEGEGKVIREGGVVGEDEVKVKGMCEGKRGLVGEARAKTKPNTKYNARNKVPRKSHTYRAQIEGERGGERTQTQTQPRKTKKQNNKKMK